MHAPQGGLLEAGEAAPAALSLSRRRELFLVLRLQNQAHSCLVFDNTDSAHLLLRQCLPGASISVCGGRVLTHPTPSLQQEEGPGRQDVEGQARRSSLVSPVSSPAWGYPGADSQRSRHLFGSGRGWDPLSKLQIVFL